MCPRLLSTVIRFRQMSDLWLETRNPTSGKEGRDGRRESGPSSGNRQQTKCFSRILHILFLDRPLTITERNSLLCRPFFILLCTFVVILVVCLNWCDSHTDNYRKNTNLYLKNIRRKKLYILGFGIFKKYLYYPK